MTKTIYLNNDFELVEKKDATFAKVIVREDLPPFFIIIKQDDGEELQNA